MNVHKYVHVQSELFFQVLDLTTEAQPRWNFKTIYKILKNVVDVVDVVLVFVLLAVLGFVLLAAVLVFVLLAVVLLLLFCCCFVFVFVFVTVVVQLLGFSFFLNAHLLACSPVGTQRNSGRTSSIRRRGITVK